MKIILILALACSSLASATAEFKLIKSSNPDEYLANHISLFLNNGEIVHIDKSKQEQLEIIRDAILNNMTVTLERKTNFEDKSDIIKSVYALETRNMSIEVESQNNKEMFSLERFNRVNFTSLDPLERSNITRLKSYSDAESLMNTFNGDTRMKSECYNRAHMWTYESVAKQGITLGKVWIFFTRKYIREFRHKWWFHVAPYTNVNDDNGKYILDRGFTMIPYNLENWKNMFIKNKASCPVIKDYNQYENDYKNAYCYLIYSSQYYWQPWQIENLSNKQEHRWGYKGFELKKAYKDSLGRRHGKYPELRANPNGGNTTTPTNSRVDYKRRLGYGEQVYNIPKDNKKVKILSAQSDGTYTIKFLEGPNSGRTGNNWRRHTLAVTNGCARTICVGDNLINLSQDSAKVRVLAIQLNGNFVLEFLSGQHQGKRGNNWLHSELRHQ